MKEIILIDKPKGVSAFRIVAQVRKLYGIKKVSHAGTLDAFSSGLLVLGAGIEGTKKTDRLQNDAATYEITARLGVQTTTGDVDGEVIRRLPVKPVTQAQVELVLKDMLGKFVLPVPKFTAVKQGGEAMYKRVRRGEELDPPMRTISITEAYFKSITSNKEGIDVAVTLTIKGGPYIRAIVEEFGRKLGQQPATLATLCRTKVGEYKIENSQTVATLQK